MSANLQDQKISLITKGIGVNLIGKLIGRGTHFISQIILARFLGPFTYGLFALGWTIFRIISIISTLGMESAVMVFLQDAWQFDRAKLKGFLFQIFKTTSIFGILIGMVFLLLSPTISVNVFGKPDFEIVLRGIAPMIFFAAVVKLSASVTRIDGSMKFTVMAEEIWQPVSNLLLVSCLLAIGWGLNGALLAVNISFLLALGYIIRQVFTLYPDLSQKKKEFVYPLSSILAFSVPTAISTLFISLIIWVDRILLGIYLPASEIGIYSSINQFPLIISMIIGSIATAVAPHIKRIKEFGNDHDMREVLSLSMRWGLFISLPLIICFIVFPREIIHATFGLEYTSGAVPLSILSFAQLINVGSGAVITILILAGFQKKVFKDTLIILLLDIFLNITLIPRYGIVGAAVATSASTSVLYIVGLLRFSRQYNLPSFRPYFFKYLVGSILAATSLVFLRNLTTISAISLSVTGLIFSMLVIYASLFIMGYDFQEIKELIPQKDNIIEV